MARQRNNGPQFTAPLTPRSGQAVEEPRPRQAESPGLPELQDHTYQPESAEARVSSSARPQPQVQPQLQPQSQPAHQMPQQSAPQPPVPAPAIQEPALPGPPRQGMRANGGIANSSLPLAGVYAPSATEQVLDQWRLAGQQFFLVVLPDAGPPRQLVYSTSHELTDAIQALLGQDVSLFAFLGYSLAISKGPHRYLVTPVGSLPLFPAPRIDEMEFEENGFVGKPKPELAPPTQPEDAVAEEVENGEPDSGPPAEIRDYPAAGCDTPVLPE